MSSTSAYPGEPHHQALLQAITSFYADEARILAVAVFGSLGRGTWDQYSDLDLDVVVADGVAVDALTEVRRLCDALAGLGERALLVVPDRDDAADVVLESLTELSIRYHPLQTTSPNIVDSLHLLTGRIDAETIKAAGTANRRRDQQGLPAHGLDRYLRFAVEVDVALQRRRFWHALQLIQLMHGLLLHAFAWAHGSARPIHAFQDQADAVLQARLGATLPGYSLRSAQAALAALLDLVEQDLAAFTGGHIELSEAHRQVIARVRQRQAALHLPDDSP